MKIRKTAFVVIMCVMCSTVRLTFPPVVNAQGDAGREDLEGDEARPERNQAPPETPEAPSAPAEPGDGQAGSAPPPVIRVVCVGGRPTFQGLPEDMPEIIPEDSTLTDWIQLVNGEMLGGELLTMRDGSLEFDSDELGVVTVDWADIRALGVMTPHSYVREDLVPIRGLARLSEGELVVCTATGEQRIPADQVFGIVEAAEREIERWSFDLSVGYSGNFGTSRQDVLNGSARLRREDFLSRFTLGYDANWGRARADGNVETTINNMWGRLGLDFFVSRKFYITAAQGRVGYDEFQNLRLRATPGAGVGYRIFDGGPDWDVAIGGVYAYTEFRSVAEGTDQTRSDAGITLATLVELDLTADLELNASHVATLLFTELGQSNFTTKASIEYDLTDEVEVRASLYWDRLSSPTRTDDGVRPSRDTITVTAGLGIDL